MKWTNVRFCSGSVCLRVNFLFSLSKKISPHKRSANPLTSREPVARLDNFDWKDKCDNEPKESAYICAKERNVKHHAMSVLANATFPRSGVSRSSGSGFNELPRMSVRSFYNSELKNKPDYSVNFFDGVLDFVKCIRGLDSEF